MEAVALTVKATQARQHQHSSLRLSCYLLMWAVAYLVKWNWCCSACVTHHNEFVALSVNLPTFCPSWLAPRVIKKPSFHKNPHSFSWFCTGYMSNFTYIQGFPKKTYTWWSFEQKHSIYLDCIFRICGHLFGTSQCVKHQNRLKIEPVGAIWKDPPIPVMIATLQ